MQWKKKLYSEPRTPLWHSTPDSCGTALMWCSPGARTLSGSPLGLVLLLHWTPQTWKHSLQPPPFFEKGNCTLWARGEMTYIDRGFCLFSLVGPSSCKWVHQFSKFDWSKKHGPDWSDWSLFYWVIEDADGNIDSQLQLKEKTSVLMRNSFIRGWLVWQKHSAGGEFSAGGRQLVQDSPWSPVCVRDPCAEMAARLCFVCVCLFVLFRFLRFYLFSLAGMAQWIEHWHANQKAASSIPGHSPCLGCRPDLQLGAFKRQLISHIAIPLPLFLLPFPPL